ncbi:hypothetical protein GCM10020256_15900 [Streptomyces thermocoprophilus]
MVLGVGKGCRRCFAGNDGPVDLDPRVLLVEHVQAVGMGAGRSGGVLGLDRDVRAGCGAVVALPVPDALGHFCGRQVTGRSVAVDDELVGAVGVFAVSDPLVCQTGE